MRAIIIGSSLSGKTTLKNFLQSKIETPILEIDDELSRINGGKYPTDDNYKHQILAPKIIKEILNKDDIIFFTNTDYFTEDELKKAQKKGFKIIQLEVTLEDLKKRSEVRVKEEGRDDWSQWLEGMLKYQKEIKDKGLVDKVISMSQPIEKAKEELLAYLVSGDNKITGITNLDG